MVQRYSRSKYFSDQCSQQKGKETEAPLPSINKERAAFSAKQKQFEKQLVVYLYGR